MKKVQFKKWSILALGLASITMASGCGGMQGEIVNKFDEQTLVVCVYNGGYGTEWAQIAADRFNEANKGSKYTIAIDSTNKYGPGDVNNMVKEQIHLAQKYCAFLTPQSTFKMQFVLEDYYEDLSSLLDTKASSDTKTIGERLQNKDVWLDVAADGNGNGCYMLPYADSMMGFVFDYDRFVDEGWLWTADGSDQSVLSALTAQGISYTVEGKAVYFTSYSGDYEYFNYTAGDQIMRAGKDGKYGTYDDGQPQTYAEWEEMVSTIRYSGVYPFIFTGDYAHTYISSAFYSTFGQFVGSDNFELFYNYESGDREVKMKDGSTTKITMETGYKVYGMDGIAQGVDFLYTYLNSDPSRAVNKNYVHPYGEVNSGFSHKNAQSAFIYGAAQGATKSNPESAMLLDGVWWENEASAAFTAIAEDGYTEYGVGKRDYRYMLTPSYAEQIPAQDQTVFSCYDTGAIVMPKMVDYDATINAEKKDYMKQFLTYLCSEEICAVFTTETGSIRPYDYTLSNAQIQSLTPFARNFWAMSQDSEHISFVRQNILDMQSPLYFKSTRGSSLWTFTYNGVTHTGDAQSWLNIIKSMQADSAVTNIGEEFATRIKEYAEDNWSKYISEYNDYEGN